MRTLERRAVAGDVEAGRALARALERAGTPRRPSLGDTVTGVYCGVEFEGVLKAWSFQVGGWSVAADVVVHGERRDWLWIDPRNADGKSLRVVAVGSAL